MRRLGGLAVVLVGLSVVVVPTASAAEPWNLAAIEASGAWRLARGAGQVVAVIDSGVDLDHPDLAGRLTAGYDFVDDDDVPEDSDGHGTHVAGVVAAVAPTARIMPLRVLDAVGNGSIDDTIAAVVWAVRHGATVLNLSLTGETPALVGTRVTAALEWAWDRGVISVLAASDRSNAPDGFDYVPVVVVTATTSTGRAADYAGVVGDARWGVAAPGGDLDGRGVMASDLGGSKSPMAGTSMAVPHVAGAIAVVRSLGLSAHETVIRVLATARDLGSPGRDPDYGSGQIDLRAAVEGLGAGMVVSHRSDPGRGGQPEPSLVTLAMTIDVAVVLLVAVGRVLDGERRRRGYLARWRSARLVAPSWSASG